MARSNPVGSTIVPATAAQGGATWQRRYAEAVSSVAELLDLLGLDAAAVGVSEAAARGFPLRVPRGFVARMRRGDAHDPLLRQVLPVTDETLSRPGFVDDPVAEAQAAAAPGLLRKYAGRALLVVTGACAVHCRYCFRRHFPYGDQGGGRKTWSRALDAIAADPTIDEVILSGGDPLSVHDDKLAALASALADIRHLRRLRVHSRLPIVLPERVDDGLLAWLAGTRLRPVMVLHANHAAELDGGVRSAVGRLAAAGVPVLNQAVLLAGVNDTAGRLVALSEALFDAGVVPYYLHLLDPVAGAAHFEVSEDRARRLLAAVRARLPGYLVPRLVREVPGAPSKLPLVERATSGMGR